MQRGHVLHPSSPLRDLVFSLEVAVAHRVRPNQLALHLDVVERNGTNDVLTKVLQLFNERARGCTLAAALCSAPLTAAFRRFMDGECRECCAGR